MATRTKLDAVYNAPRKCADVALAAQQLQQLYRDFPEQVVAAIGLFEPHVQAFLTVVIKGGVI